ncbi:type II secretion system F family protein [Candidatus Aerophobetes bacterium]|uniref:Type II secretion system F family protein n=1 Tax=Aerophobetes bacterium TaxID=2030807 RepID=A0A523RZ12_UNCAE|nr:MAG: type II secretion system F family protein [Candidatus Aerophobetes bacterium]
MAAYHYLALNREGTKIKGLIEADSERKAITQLRPRGLFVISLKKNGNLFNFVRGKTGTGIRIFKPTIKSKDIIIFLRQFATLINAGLPVVQALAIMIDQTPHSTLKEKITQIKKDVEAGMPLSEALAKHPKAFSTLSCNMIKAGEMGGVLDVILTRLASYLESTENIKEKTKTAMRYPVFVMFMAFGLIGALTLFVLPKMKTLFQESFQAELPFLTQLMLDLSDFVRTKFYFVLIIIAALGALYHFIKKSNKGSYSLDQLKLKLPIMGKLFHKICLSRFTRTLATLFSSGVPILDSLDMTGKTAGNKVIEKAVKEAISSLKEGETLAGPLKKYPVFPPIVVSMIAVGEQTGSLDEMLDKISDFYDREIEVMVDSFASMLEPLLLGVLGITIGIAVVAMYLPYFTMFQYIGG